MTNTTIQEAQEALKDMPSSLIQYGQAVSVCSLFVEMEQISLSIDQITEGLFDRFQGCIPKDHVKTVVLSAVDFGLQIELLDSINTSITPTEGGWQVGADWLKQIKNDSH
jgi:hypothetical protein